MADPYPDICGVAGDHFSGFLEEKTRRPQDRANEQAAKECLVDDEKPSPEIAIIFPVLLVMIVRFGILSRIGEVAVTMVL